MASENSVGVNNNPNIISNNIPLPKLTDSSPLEQDQNQINNILEFTSGSSESSVTGSVMEEIEDEGPEDFVLSDEEYFIEEVLSEEVLSEPEDETQYQDFTTPPDTIINKDLEIYPFLGVYLNNNKIKNISCRLINGKPVKEELIIPFINLKEACLNDIKISIIITSGYRPAYDNIFYSGKLLATSQKTLRSEPPSSGNLRLEYVGKFKNPENDLTLEISSGKEIKLGPSNRIKYFIADTAPAGTSNHGNGLALDLNTGSRKNLNFGSLNELLYTWLINNSWRYGFIRTVASEEWHWEYLPELAKLGPYGKLIKSEKNGFYNDLKLLY